MRTRLLVSLVVTLTVAACGGDDGDVDGGSATTTGPVTDELLDDDAYVATLADSLADPDAGFGASADEARCAAEGMVDRIGAERLQQAGLTEANLFSDETVATELTDEEANQVVDVLFECIDFGAAFARSFGEDASPEQASCLSDRLGDESLLREPFVASLREGGDASIDGAAALQLSEAFFDCLDIAQLFIDQISADVQLTAEQERCLRDAISVNDDLRQALADTFSGGAGSSEAVAAALLADVERCVPEAFSGAG